MTSRRGLAGVLVALAATAAPALGAPPPIAVQPRAAPPAPPATPPPAPPQPSAPDPNAAAAARALAADRAAHISTPLWREPREPFDLGWHALALPEYLVELAFSPLGFVVGAVEQYRIDTRIIDFLRNDAGTIKVVPLFKFAGGDGLGGGASLELEDLLYHAEKFELGGLIQVNRDHRLLASYTQSLASLDGRTLAATVDYDFNSDLGFYGLGNDSRPADRRVVAERELEAAASIEVFERGAGDSYGLVEVGYRRTGLRPGSKTGVEPAGEPGDDVAPPADFRRTLNYGRLGLILRHDSRDTPARTQRGILAEVSAHVTSDLERGADFNALSMRGEITGYVPVLPLFRVLVARVGVQGTLPVTGDGQVPLDEYVLLDRRDGLRGYPNYRFRDRLGWWAALEYHYPIYQFEDSDFMLSPIVFADAGRVAGTFTDLWKSDVRWDVGFGFAGELTTALLLLVDVGRSPEGWELGFNLGKQL
ncbi:MAG TPA: BamA/TamA family outer membrane protein [Kofleriaceae bacterium]|nr:BamA/TamA family outer membrane protein [Kofleriaceae bacterium]